MSHIYFITGASGVGKTTLVAGLEVKYKNKLDWLFLHFDSIGVPPTDEMISKFGSVENWQRETTRIWIKKMITDYASKSVIIIEGQVNLNFIKEAFEQENFPDYTTVLVDSNKSVMRSRLTEGRMQPELATEAMDNWRDALRRQAEELHVDIIDTNKFNKEQSIAMFEKILDRGGFL